MKRLVLIHGRSQQNLDPAALKQEWLDSLNRGLKAIHLELPAVESVCFPYYGDSLTQLCNGLTSEQAAAVVLRGKNSDDGEHKLFREMIFQAAATLGVTDAQAVAELGATEVDRGAQNWPIVLAFARLLSHIPGINTEALALITHDVFQYLSQSGIAAFIDRGIKAAFTPNVETVVVSHSLGTLVAYRILRDLDKTYSVTQFITLGSPLGIPTIQDMLTPLKRPSCVGQWSNARDPHDIVALYPLTLPDFPIRSILDKSDVANFTSNHHSIPGYLEDPIVARWVYDALL